MSRRTARLATTEQLAEALQVSTRTVRRLREAGRIAPVAGFAGTVRWDVDDVVAALKDRR